MKKARRQFKIMQGVVALCVMALISIIFIGGLALKNIGNINKNVENIYSQQLTRIEYLGDIDGDMGILRNSITKIIDRPYDEKQVEIVRQEREEIQNYIKLTNDIKSTQETQQLLSGMENDFNEYMKGAEDIIERRKNGEKLQLSFMESYGKIGTDISKKVKTLKAQSKLEAESLYKDSQKMFTESRVAFLIIFAVTIILIFAVFGFLYSMIRESIKEFSGILKTMSSGDFTIEVDTKQSNEFGVMKKELSNTILSISSILKSIKENMNNVNGKARVLTGVSEEITSSSKQIASAVEEVANGSSSQSQELFEMANLLNSFGDTVHHIVISIDNVDENAKDINIKADSSNKQLNQLIQSVDNMSKSFQEVNGKIERLGYSVNQINQITILINNISDQTNLLALNAAIEAARAGEAGKGFAVVADEIRKLAEQSKNSSSEIGDLVQVISKETNGVIDTIGKANKELDEQVEVINSSIHTFRDIITSIEEISPLIENTKYEVNKIDNEKNEIINRIETASAVAEENTASAEEISASTQQMNMSSQEVFSSADILLSVTDETLQQVNKFKLK